MNELRNSINKLSERKTEILLLFIALTVRMINVGMIFFGPGPFYGGDTQRYNEWANQIAQQGLSYYANNIDKPYYWGYPTIIALVRMLTGDDRYLLVLNGLMSAAAVIFLYRTALLVFANKPVALLTGIIYGYFPECMRWDTTIYSDSIGLFLEILCVYLYFRQKSLSGIQRRRCIFALILAEIPFFLIRTTSSITILLIAFALMKNLSRKKKITVIAVLLCAAAVILIFLFTKSSGEHGLVQRMKYYIGLFESGTIVYETNTYSYTVNPTHIGKPIFLLDVLAIVLIRMVFFWSMFFKSYDLVEKLLRGISFTFIYIFGFPAIFKMLRSKDKRPAFLILLIFVTNIIQAFFEVDGSQRYRLPIIPWVIMFAAYGVKLLVERVEKVRGDKL